MELCRQRKSPNSSTRALWQSYQHSHLVASRRDGRREWWNWPSEVDPLYVVKFYDMERANFYSLSEERRYEKLDRFNFEASWDFHYSTCIKRLRAHPRHLNRASQLASRKRGLKTTEWTVTIHNLLASDLSSLINQPLLDYPCLTTRSSSRTSWPSAANHGPTVE
jgi:hypothetical protein